MLSSGTEPELYITEYTFVYEDKGLGVRAPCPSGTATPCAGGGVWGQGLGVTGVCRS